MIPKEIAVFVTEVMPAFTIGIFVIGWLLRISLWAGLPYAWKLTAPIRRDWLPSVVKNWTVNLLPPVDLAAKLDPVFYVVGLAMHLSFVALIFTKVHLSALLKVVGLDFRIDFFVPKTFTNLISIVFVVCLSLMIFRRVFQYASNRALRSISGVGDFIAAPLLWAVGFTGYLIAHPLAQPSPLPIYQTVVTLHLILTQLFIMYVPFSKFLHGITVFIVRTFFGIRRAIYRV